MRLAHVLVAEGHEIHAVLEKKRRRHDLLKPVDPLDDHLEDVVIVREGHRDARVMLRAVGGSHLGKRQMVALPGETVSTLPFRQVADVLEVEISGIPDRETDVVGDHRATLDGRFEDVDPGLQFLEAGPACADPVIGPEHVRRDLQEVDRVEIRAQEFRKGRVVHHPDAEPGKRRQRCHPDFTPTRAGELARDYSDVPLTNRASPYF